MVFFFPPTPTPVQNVLSVPVPVSSCHCLFLSLSHLTKGKRKQWFGGGEWREEGSEEGNPKWYAQPKGSTSPVTALNCLIMSAVTAMLCNPSHHHAMSPSCPVCIVHEEKARRQGLNDVINFCSTTRMSCKIGGKTKRSKSCTHERPCVLLTKCWRIGRG